MKWPWRRRVEGPPWTFHDPRIAALEPFALRALMDEVLGRLRQLEATATGIENAHRDVMARLQEVIYREDSTYARWTKVAKDMAEVPPPEED